MTGRMTARCGEQTRPEQKRPTLWCQREKGHDGPHHVYGGDGQPIREWSPPARNTTP